MTEPKSLPNWAENGVHALIWLSLVTLVLETIPDLAPETYAALDTAEMVIAMVFLVEYGVRVARSRPWTGYAFSALGIIDLMAFLPSLLSFTALDLRVVRALRLFRAFRILKLQGCVRAIQRFERIYGLVRDELIVVVFTCLLLVFISSVGIYAFEHEAQPEVFRSIPDAMWWSLVTFTTIGYGDMVPITLGGRLFAAVFLFVGIGFIAIPTAILAGAWNRVLRDDFERHPAAETPKADEPADASAETPNST